MRIDLPGIEAFLSIANWGSFKRAAAHLNLSQAALSHRLKKLEENLGVPLLARTTRQVTMTPAGLELLPVAQRTVQEISSTLDGLRERGKSRHERLAIGCLPTISLLYLPSILAEFQRQRPQTIVQVYDNSTAEIAGRVRAGEADLGLTILSANSWDLEITPLLKDPFVLVCLESHPFAGRPFVQWQELVGEPLIRISAETGNRSVIDEALGRRRELMSWRYEVQHVATAIGLVRAGMGLTVVPKIGLDATDRARMVAVPLRNPSVARTLGIVARRGDPLSPGAVLLVKLVSASLKKIAMPADELSNKSNNKRPLKIRDHI
jgi:DNA-binding transcriptional LysR family regulator